MNNLVDVPLFAKVIAVIAGGLFALTLTGDIDKQGKLALNIYVFVRLFCSAAFGFYSGSWLIEYMDWGSYSYVTHGFIQMMCSIFGMAVVGVVYQAFKLSTTDKTMPQLIQEIKEAFKAIMK